MLDVKQIIYDSICDLSIRVSDNPNYNAKHSKCPYAIIRTTLEKPMRYKNYTKVKWVFRIDVFSDYKGEKEIKDYYEQEINEKMNLVQEEDGITYVESSLTIMDDKELGPVLKHGVISIAVDTMEVE